MDSSQESGMPTQVDSKSESHDVMSLVSTFALSYASAINVISLTCNKALVGSSSLLFKHLVNLVVEKAKHYMTTSISRDVQRRGISGGIFES
jgi:hypothetical protein